MFIKRYPLFISLLPLFFFMALICAELSPGTRAPDALKLV
jgi:hypothetical protein